MTNFIIFSVPHAGAELLADIISSHPDAVCHYELFKADSLNFAPRSHASSHSIGSVEMRDWSPLSFVRRVWNAHDNANAIGFVMPNRQHRLVFQTLLDDPEVKKVIVTRDDQLATFIESEQYLQLCKVQGSTQIAKKIVAKPPVYVDRRKLRQRLNHDHDYYYELAHRLDKTGQKALWLEYQNLQRPSTSQRLLGFLELRFFELTLAKNLSKNGYLVEHIDHYEELVDVMPELKMT